MVQQDAERGRAAEVVLPPGTAAFLRDVGVPERIELCGIEHEFTLDMEPLLGGVVLRIGGVDRGAYAMAVKKQTGHFGYVLSGPDSPPWVFCSTSVAQFLDCVAASERLWVMERGGQIAREDRGDFLESEIRRIDPVVLADHNNPWSVLVEELRAGAV